MFKFSQKSLNILANAEEDLQKVATLALSYSKYDFGITESVRSIEKQKENVRLGRSQTMSSRHMPNQRGKSEAIDIIIYVGGKVTWEPKHYRKVAEAFYRAAFELGIAIEWGGHWESLFDGPHYELAKWSK